MNAPSWVGVDNFVRLFNDPLFGVAWRNTLLFTGLALVFGFLVPFFTAVLLNELRHARAYFRLVVYLPVMLPPVVPIGTSSPACWASRNIVALGEPVAQAMKAWGLDCLIRSSCALTLTSVGLKCWCETILMSLFSGLARRLSKA